MHLSSKNWAFGALLAMSTACGGSSSNAGGSSDGGAILTGEGGVPASITQACTDYETARCNKRDTCSLNGYENLLDYGLNGTQQCISANSAPCVFSLMAKGTAQTPENLETCTALIATESCVDFRDGNPSGACLSPAGALANGSACGANAQCASAFCTVGPYAICGTCQPAPAAGASCQSTSQCGYNMACEKPDGATTAVVGVCAVYASTGAACLPGTTPCAATLSCVGAVVSTKTTGTCQAAGATVGAACDSSAATLPSCDANLGLFCMHSADAGAGIGTCQTKTLVQSGMSCGTTTGDGGIQDSVCAISTCVTGSCQPDVDNGTVCSLDTPDASALPCAPETRCVPGSQGSMTGTCTALDTLMCN